MRDKLSQSFMAETALKILAAVEDVLTSDDSEEVSPHKHELLHISEEESVESIAKDITDHCWAGGLGEWPGSSLPELIPSSIANGELPHPALLPLSYQDLPGGLGLLAQQMKAVTWNAIANQCADDCIPLSFPTTHLQQGHSLWKGLQLWIWHEKYVLACNCHSSAQSDEYGHARLEPSPFIYFKTKAVILRSYVSLMQGDITLEICLAFWCAKSCHLHGCVQK